MIIAHTDRLHLRHINVSDAQFIYQLYNQPSFIKYIGDRGIHSVTDAEAFISKVKANYLHYGFWLYLVEDKESNQPLGVNGLIQRDYLDAPDIGFALMPEYCGKGFAKESSLAVLQHAKQLKLTSIYAITSPDNTVSESMLNRLGFVFQRQDFFDGSATPINLFTLNLEQ